MLFQTAISGCREGQGEAKMKLHYDRETDSLYIDLKAKPSADSREISDRLFVDYDSEGRVVGIDIQHASKVLDLDTLETESFPAGKTRLA